MGVEYLVAQFLDENYVRDRVVYLDDAPVGILAPTTLFGFDNMGAMYIHGRKGCSKLEGADKESFWETVINVDAILFGNPDEVQKVKELLEDKRMSRTASYLSTLPGGCKEFIRRIQNIMAAKILIVGCGGIGSISAMNMAGAGVKQITLVDHDKVERSNLNRQFFWRLSDEDEYKVDVLERAIGERWPDVLVAGKKMFDMSVIKDVMLEHDAVIITADEPLGLGAEVAEKSSVFVVSGGYFHGYLGYFAMNPGLSAPKMQNSQQIKWERNPFFIAPSSGPGNTEIAGVVSSACLHYLADKEYHREFFLNDVWRSSRIN